MRDFSASPLRLRLCGLSTRSRGHAPCRPRSALASSPRLTMHSGPTEIRGRWCGRGRTLLDEARRARAARRGRVPPPSSRQALVGGTVGTSPRTAPPCTGVLNWNEGDMQGREASCESPHFLPLSCADRLVTGSRGGGDRITHVSESS